MHIWQRDSGSWLSRLRASLHTCRERQTRRQDSINHLRHKDNTIWHPHNLLWSHYRFLDSFFNCAECWLCHKMKNKVLCVKWKQEWRWGCGISAVISGLEVWSSCMAKNYNHLPQFTMCISNKGKLKHPTVEILLWIT